MTLREGARITLGKQFAFPPIDGCNSDAIAPIHSRRQDQSGGPSGPSRARCRRWSSAPGVARIEQNEHTAVLAEFAQLGFYSGCCSFLTHYPTVCVTQKAVSRALPEPGVWRVLRIGVGTVPSWISELGCGAWALNGIRRHSVRMRLTKRCCRASRPRT